MVPSKSVEISRIGKFIYNSNTRWQKRHGVGITFSNTWSTGGVLYNDAISF
jgi:hypothetical protein